MISVQPRDFADWRSKARALLVRSVPPHNIIWNEQSSLFSDDGALPPATRTVNVPRDFLRLAERVACHRNPERWGLLYDALWRLATDAPHLMRMETDPVMHQLFAMEKAIRRDVHKTKAFVRFRRVEDALGEHFIAWHRPDHPILPLVAPFFMRRFSDMRWTIMTPDATVHWDLEELHFTDGVSRDEAPGEDMLEDLWRDYYRATFNPARIKIKAMKREMPVRHWATLPEAQIISDLLLEAPKRVETMIKHAEGLATSAADYLPEQRNLPALREAARGCQGCPLYEHATQTVFGEGPARAQFMLVGEQPGNEEDLAGHPFIGPAGKVLMKAMKDAKIEREQFYITNAVKHFKFSLVNDLRIHTSPGPREVNACRPWLEAEVAAVKPEKILCLGATAGKSLLGRGFTLKLGRGVWQEFENVPTTATYHPSAVLRARGDDHKKIYHAIVEDLERLVA